MSLYTSAHAVFASLNAPRGRRNVAGAQSRPVKGSLCYVTQTVHKRFEFGTALKQRSGSATKMKVPVQ